MSQQVSQQTSTRCQAHRTSNASTLRPLHVVRAERGQVSFPIVPAPGEDGSVQPGKRLVTVMIVPVGLFFLLTLIGRCAGLV